MVIISVVFQSKKFINHWGSLKWFSGLKLKPDIFILEFQYSNADSPDHCWYSNYSWFWCCIFSVSTPIACSAGTYSLGSNTTCTTCPAGKKCPNTDGTGIEDCPSGQYALAGSVTCTLCPRGYACPDPASSVKVKCDSGTYSTGEQASCTQCPAGYYCPSTVTDIEYQCPDGTYSVGNQSSCTNCPKGYECPSTTFDSRLVLNWLGSIK